MIWWDLTSWELISWELNTFFELLLRCLELLCLHLQEFTICVHLLAYRCLKVQWNLSNMDTLDQNIIVLISEVSSFQEENNYIKLGNSQVFSLTKVSILRRYPLERFHWNTKQCNLYFCSYNCWCTKNPGEGPQERLHLLSHLESFSHRSNDKTSLKHRLFGEETPGLCCSTALAGAEIQAIIS